MNTITFMPIASADPANPYREVEVAIDGVSLIDRLREVERPFAEEEESPDLAGNYAGLPGLVGRLAASTIRTF